MAATTRQRTASATRRKRPHSAGTQPRAPKLIYYFGQTRTDGGAGLAHLLGAKGASLAEMTSIGLPVPPGFTITTEVCDLYYRHGRRLPAGLMKLVRATIDALEKERGRTLGDAVNPLLVSVRSGVAESMPGMMNAILNLGLNDVSVVGVADATGNERFAYDAYRRLIRMFGQVVMGINHEVFDHTFDRVKSRHKARLDTDVPTMGMIELCKAYKALYHKHAGEEFPQDPLRQLELAIEAVYMSWMAPRAVRYRQVENITGLLGTAVSVQSMVFGNMGTDSGTGVAFTRDPATGENRLYGEFLVNAQGDDVVAGIRTPQPLEEMARWNKGVFRQLLEIKARLEKHYRDLQDIEFTIERDKLHVLQARAGKRTGAAAVRIACDMVREKLIDRRTALTRVPADDLTQLLLPSFDPAALDGAEVLATGVPASPGAAVGKLAFSADEAATRARGGEQVLLVRKETSAEDIEGMHAARGILTSTGGMTSYAAVVARGWGRCCVAGAAEIQVLEKARKITIRGRSFTHRDTLAIDGTTGRVMAGAVATREPEPSGDFAQIMKWADEHRTLRVRADADSPADAQRARQLGAEGIGLCRTEPMFFDADRINAMRRMILADSLNARQVALADLLPLQRRDFVGIFKAMDGLPVAIRLLDPPLHEFLPQDPIGQNEVAQSLGISASKVKARVTQLHETNPMLGHRGCRLCVTYPEILQMQVQAIVEAVIECRRRNIDARAEIMIPLVGTARELRHLRELAVQTIEQVKDHKRANGPLDIPVGTMIQVPRAALTAHEIAEHADFLSFGTGDLTQLAFGYSREDAASFMPQYLKEELLERDPFQSLDAAGVGQLVSMAVSKGRATRAKLQCGICGEHGGDPDSIRFCHAAGLDYVSCPPFRVPIARLAAAQAALAAR